MEFFTIINLLHMTRPKDFSVSPDDRFHVNFNDFYDRYVTNKIVDNLCSNAKQLI